jgi:MFS family permease
VDSGYAWVRLAASLGLTTVGCAGMYVCMVGMPAYGTDFGIGRAAASLPFTLVMLGFGVGGIAIGWLVDRLGIVRPLAGATVLLAASFAIAARVDSFAAFAALHFMIGAMGCAAVFSPLLADISHWFERRRGFAIAICASGNYLAGTLWPPVVEALFAASGWRETYLVFALLSVVLMLPLLLVLRRPPPPAHEQVAGGSAGSPAVLGLTPGALVALLCVAGVGCCMAMAMPQAHVVALAVDLGLDAARGAQMLSVMFGFGVLSRLAFGVLSDRIGGLATLLVGSTLQCIALALFLAVDGERSLFIVCALFGLFQGGIVPCYALIVREYFPAAEAGARTGVVIFATLMGMVGGAWASGAIFDATGSYDAAFLHGVAWNLLNMAIIGHLLIRARRAASGGTTPAVSTT